jgi:hypothetical protein
MRPESPQTRMASSVRHDLPSPDVLRSLDSVAMGGVKRGDEPLRHDVALVAAG